MAGPRRHWLRWVLLSLLGVLILVPTGGWVWLQSSGGREFVRAKVLALTATVLPGKLEVGSLKVGATALHATGLKLFTPEGDLVAEVAALDATYSLGTLVGKTVTIRDAQLTEPRLLLVDDERGLNLVRAVSKPDEPGVDAGVPGPPTAWTVKVDGLTLNDGEFDYRDEERHYSVQHLGARGGARIALGPMDIDGKLTLGGVVSAPVQGPLALSTTVDTRGLSEASLTLADLRLRAKGELVKRSLTIEELVAPQDTVRAFLPSWPLKVPLSAQGVGSLTHLQVAAQAGSGTVDATGDWTQEPLTFHGVKIAAKSLKLEELLGVKLASSLDLEASGELSDVRPDSLDGHLALDARWTAPNRRSIARLQGKFDATAGDAKLERLELQAPGVALSVAGVASLRQLDLKGTLTASDLSRLPAALSDFLGVSLPPLGGKGSLRLAAHGPISHPKATAVGELSTLRLASFAAEHLEIDASLANALKPLDASIGLHARKLSFGVTPTSPGRVLEEVAVTAVTRSRLLKFELSTRGLGDLKIHLDGLLDQDLGGARIDALGLEATTWAWAQEAPAHISWRDGVDLEPLSLRDGAQHLLLSGRLRGSAVNAKVTLEHLILEKLPKALLPETMGLAGELSASGAVQGSLAAPDAEAEVAWTRGALAGVTGIEAKVQAGWKKDRLAGTLSLASSHGQAKADFDVPLAAVLAQRPEPLSAHFAATGIDLNRVEVLLNQTLPTGGVFEVDLVASGTGAKPNLELTVQSERLSLDYPTRYGEILDVVKPKVVLRTREDQKLRAEVTALIFDGSVQASLDTPYSLASLRKHLPTLAELQAAPAHVDLAIENIQVLALDTMQFIDAPALGGIAGLTGTIDGSVKDPTVALTLTGDKLSLPPVVNLGLSMKLEGDAHRTKATATISGPDVEPIALDAQLAAGVRELPELAVLSSRAVSMKVTIPSFELSKVLEGEDEAPPPGGAVAGTISLTGTLDAPKLLVEASVKKLHFEKTVLGAANLKVEGTAAGQTLVLGLGGDAADQLQVTGTFGLPLSLSKLRAEGTKVGDSKVHVDLKATDLDVAFLSGVQPVLRALGGTVNLNGSLTGTLGAPKFVGDAHWAKGRLALMGYGDYREITLDATATNDTVDVSKLVAHSGGGEATLQAHLARQAKGSYHLTGNAQTTKFPIVVDDQLLATASVKLEVKGDVTGSLVDLSAIDVSRADVDLPDIKRKDLQDLQRPDDILILKAGSRISRARLAMTKSTPPSTLALRFVINAPRNLWVRSSDLNIEVGLSDAFRIETGAAVQLYGSASPLRGDVSVIGRKFTVQKDSTVTFSGNPLNPAIDVSAVYVNEAEKITVTVSAVGRGANIALRATSDPPLAESDIYSLIATGRLKLQRGSGASMTPEDAVSVVGQFAASQVKTMLAKKLPIDVLNFEALDNFSNFKFDVGKYLSDRVYLGVTAQTAANPARGENPWAGRIEYQMSRRWSLEAYAGTAPAAGADILWTKDF